MINQTFNDLLDSIKELHDKKSHDYATDSNPYSNFEFAAILAREFSDPVDQIFAGIIGIKLARLGQLLSWKKPKNESVEDTMRDLTCYCGIWTAYKKDLESPIDGNDMASYKSRLGLIPDDSANLGDWGDVMHISTSKLQEIITRRLKEDKEKVELARLAKEIDPRL